MFQSPLDIIVSAPGMITCGCG